MRMSSSTPAAVPGTRASSTMDARTFSASRAASPMRYRSTAGPQVASAGWLSLVIAAVAVLLLVFWRQANAMFQRVMRGNRDGDGGRWVRDRSLGGKMIWIPDATSSPSASSAVSPLTSPDEAFTPKPRSRSSASSVCSAVRSMSREYYFVFKIKENQ